MRLMRIALLVLVLGSLWGCASSAPPSRPAARPFDNVRRVAVVVTGDSRFTVLEHRAEPGKTFDEVLGWTPSVTFEELVGILVDAELQSLSHGQAASSA